MIIVSNCCQLGARRRIRRRRQRWRREFLCYSQTRTTTSQPVQQNANDRRRRRLTGVEGKIFFSAFQCICRSLTVLSLSKVYELWLAIFIIVPLRESPLPGWLGGLMDELGIYTAREHIRRRRRRPGGVIIILCLAPKILVRESFPSPSSSCFFFFTWWSF